MAFLIVLMQCLAVSYAGAQTATLLSTTSFGSGTPSGWYNDGHWYASSNGKSGTNGSMVCDMVGYSYYYTPGYYNTYYPYNYVSGYTTYYTDEFGTPGVDASDYTDDIDSVWVDFDFCWEYNNYDANNGDDNFEVTTGYDQLFYGSTSYGKTYEKDSNSFDIDPPMADSNWHHYHLFIPVASRSSNMAVNWVGHPYAGSSNPAIDNVRITASHNPNATRRMKLSRTSIALGQVRVGRERADSLRVTSNGNLGSIRINSSMKSGAEFATGPYWYARILPTGTSEVDSAIFYPTTRGAFNDSIIYTSNSDLAVQQRMAVYVSGQGVQAIFTPTNGTSVAFGNVRVGRTKQQTFLFSNTGDDTLFLQTPSIAGSGFTIASGPSPLVVPPSQSRSVVLQFSPTVQQSYSATLYFSASNGVTAPSIAITGVGSLPQIVISNFAAFGNERVGQPMQGTIMVSNGGNDTLNMSIGTLTQPSSKFFLAASVTMLSQGGTSLFRINYTPTSRMLDSAKLKFSTDDPQHPTDSVLVTGRGIQAIFNSNNGNTVAFGNVRAGRTAQQSFGYSNTGDDTMFLQTPSISGGAFTIVSGPSSMIVPPNQTGNVIV